VTRVLGTGMVPSGLIPQSFAQAGASNIVDRFGLGDTGSPRRKRGRGMSAALGGI
jgi:hypothetical protein